MSREPTREDPMHQGHSTDFVVASKECCPMLLCMHKGLSSVDVHPHYLLWYTNRYINKHCAWVCLYRDLYIELLSIKYTNVSY